MNCPRCNAWTDQLDTRRWIKGTYRRYECANLHKFSTLDGELFSGPKHAERNKEIRAAHEAGTLASTLAEKYGVTIGRIRRILRWPQ